LRRPARTLSRAAFSCSLVADRSLNAGENEAHSARRREPAHVDEPLELSDALAARGLRRRVQLEVGKQGRVLQEDELAAGGCR